MTKLTLKFLAYMHSAVSIDFILKSGRHPISKTLEMDELH
jgi:hypothetical protein